LRFRAVALTLRARLPLTGHVENQGSN